MKLSKVRIVSVTTSVDFAELGGAKWHPREPLLSLDALISIFFCVEPLRK
jgi:hypothetical protein